MNDFVAKKLGEVHAFSLIGVECGERAGDALQRALGTDSDTLKAELDVFAGVAAGKGNEVTTAKSEKTCDKLRGMMEAYIGDEWDNPVEILEWLSFFCGAAAAHWSLVAGAGNAIGDSELQQSAEQAKDYYLDKLNTVVARLNEVGSERAKA